MKLTRRGIARMLAAAAAVPSAVPLKAQPPDRAQAAREQFDKNAQAMANVKIPMATEPPLQFKA